MKKTLLVLGVMVLFFTGCHKDNEYEEGDSYMSVMTKDVSHISETGAQCGGNVEIRHYGIDLESKGVCWGTSPNPTINDNKTENGSGTGNFTSNLTNLTDNTTYYVRAYATHKKGTSYGEEKSFKTLEITLPTVTTKEVTQITGVSALCGGCDISDGNGNVTAKGVCWSTSPNPTINDNKTENGSGTGNFTSNLTNLTENTTYYVRAYVTNEKGTGYGEEKSFKTLEITLPTVSTGDVTDITASSALCRGNYTSDGNGNVTENGVCWSTSPNPTINDNRINNHSGAGYFTSNLTNLTENTTYYVRAYATNEKGTVYGEEKSFTTLDKYNGYAYVDLGLPSGLKWAICNVGASKPEDYGNYYAWGETETKSEYTEDNCSTYGVEMSDISGNYQYDVARKKWGGIWRMPTGAEFYELMENCTCEWTMQDGKNGYNVVGPNGNSIFFPAAGFREGSSLYYAGELGDYWSSTPSDSYFSYKCSIGNVYMSIYRFRGHSVRPVAE